MNWDILKELGVSQEDFQELEARMNEQTDNSSLDGLLAELNALTGLSSVKQEINKIVRTVKDNQAEKKPDLKPSDLNMVFLGNHGTDKTAAVGLIGKIYKELGILSKGQVIEVSSDELQGNYVGEAGLRTRDAIEKALGGILIVDDAYMLADSCFGQDAFNTLIIGMECHREDLVVIVTGRADKMETFLANNAGLRSRIKIRIDFED